MLEILILLLSLCLAGAIVTILVLARQNRFGGELGNRFETLERQQDRLEQGIRQQLSEHRQEGQVQARELRDEVGTSVVKLSDSLVATVQNLSQLQEGRFNTFSSQLSSARQGFDENARLLREEVARRFDDFSTALGKSFGNLSDQQKGQLEAFSQSLQKLTESNERKFESLQKAVEERLTVLQRENERKLDEMRQTVDEKLQGTLEKRLGESFKLVSERLEQVYKGLGEMRSLASGVGDLKRVLTNVKTRGTWGEITASNLLEQILTPEQYASNVATREGSRERVDFAIRLPGRGDHDGESVWLPIDAKFPKEDYERLVEASESGDQAAVEEVGRKLESQVRNCARSIAEKYLNPPRTTDFGIMFLPTEGLYAEIVRRTALVAQIQRDFRIVVAGPTTLAALLNSLQMGFRTLAIEKRSSEVWKVLGAVKSEFGKFGAVLDQVKQKLDQASKTIDKAGVRTRAIQRKLKAVEALPDDQAKGVLGPASSSKTPEFKVDEKADSSPFEEIVTTH